MIVARSVWGASARSLPPEGMRLPAVEVIVHHSVTTVTGDVYRDMRAIEAVGLDRYGQFSYNYVVHPNGGEVLEGTGLRRGAHAERRNSTALGICWAGNYNDRHPKVQQVDATRALIGDLTRQGLIADDAPILGHRDIDATACPGQKLYAVLDAIRHPWEATVVDNPDVPNIDGPVKFEFFRDPGTGVCIGYYQYSEDTGEIHGHGPGAPYHGRSEVVT